VVETGFVFGLLETFLDPPPGPGLQTLVQVAGPGEAQHHLVDQAAGAGRGVM
jgi:hypothetical protein